MLVGSECEGHHHLALRSRGSQAPRGPAPSGFVAESMLGHEGCTPTVSYYGTVLGTDRKIICGESVTAAPEGGINQEAINAIGHT